MKPYNTVALIILDGLGINPDKYGSPWEIAKHPTFSEIEKWYPFTTLQASGIAVGLPWGEEGNSEVGHLTIGAGRVIYNYLPKISNAIKDETFFSNETFLGAIKHAKENNSALHFIGLFSSGTVHAFDKHLFALLDLAKRNDVKNVCLHLFTDGKDAKKNEGYKFFKNLEELIQKDYPFAKIASVIGRKYSMDRDGHWDKTKKTFNLFVNGNENNFSVASNYIKTQYENSITDDSIDPAMLTGSIETRIKENDSVIFFNYREDSMRQLIHSFADETFDKFERKKLSNVLLVTMTEYDKNLSVLNAFESADVKQPLAQIISESGLKQFHIAETEKYAHITYFFNGGREEPFENENRIMIESPQVESFEEAPEMSADKISDEVIKNIPNYNFLAINFANADMVGHTGNLEATSKAIETLDYNLKKIIDKILEIDGVVIITADHGNAEEKLYKMTGEKKTKHSLNPVPMYLIANEVKRKEPLSEELINASYKDVKGSLTDIAPTILELLGLPKANEMTGKSLIDKLV